ncbi:MAG: Calx-beta domain-containing protein, partial [Verrucomicrobiota bacterium]
MLIVFGSAPTQAGFVDVPIAQRTDDAEENEAGDRIRLGDSRLDLIFHFSFFGGSQHVGLRFDPVNVPAGAIITNAWIQFTANGSTGGDTDLTIEGEAADDPATFQNVDFNISTRPRTAASVLWEPPDWTGGESGPAQRTVDLTPIVQELVDRPGWAPGQSMAFIMTGNDTSSRRAWGWPDFPAVLHVAWAQIEINNDAGALITGPGAVDLNGFLTSIAGPPADVTVYWGTNDGMTVAADWEFSANLGPRGIGALSHSVTGLLSNTEYFYRYAAGDSNLSAWATNTAAFTLTQIEMTTTVSTVSEECPTPASVRVIRPGGGAGDLVVFYSVAGTATVSNDYVALPGSMTIPAGQDFADIPITPIDDFEVGEGLESVEIILLPGPYLVGGSSNVTVWISDDDVRPEEVGGLQLWLQADDGPHESPGTPAVHGDEIEIWEDRSGMG